MTAANEWDIPEFNWNNVGADSIIKDIERAIMPPIDHNNDIPRCFGCFGISNVGAGDCPRCIHMKSCELYKNHLIRTGEEIIRNAFRRK